MVSPHGYADDINNINNINNYINQLKNINNRLKNHKNIQEKTHEKNKLVYNSVVHCINQIKKNEIIRSEYINVELLMNKLSELLSLTDINSINYETPHLEPWQLETCQPVYDKYVCTPGRMVVPKKEDNTCSICMEKEKCMAFVNCGHMCVCESCCSRIEKCPICRTGGHIIKIYK